VAVELQLISGEHVAVKFQLVPGTNNEKSLYRLYLEKGKGHRCHATGVDVPQISKQ
jgi:hypothetical protein